jgi:isopenicillin N synthase-like dioxygenase
MSLTHPEIRLLDLTLARRDKPAFIAQLRDMLINDGLVYLAQTPVPTEVVDKMVDSTAKFFALPADVKDTVDMNVSAHFNGYLRRGSAENPTREQFNYGDESVSHEEGTPEYHKIHGSTPVSALTLDHFLSQLIAAPSGQTTLYFQGVVRPWPSITRISKT